MDTVFLRLRSIVFIVFVLAFTCAQANQEQPQRTLLIVGDSLSAAYGVQTDEAWVALLRARLHSEGLADWEVVNASISGETTDGGLRRLPRLLEQNNPDVVVIELGGNDGLRGFPPGVIEKNLARMIEQVQDAGARPLLVGMQIPPNYGERYTQAFAGIFPKLADQYDTALVEFFLDGIYDQEGMMQGDGIHPSAAAQGQLLANIWPQLKSLLK
ncbi:MULTISPECIES: arylesterase [Marinobacter]|jgi:acyl-CoA thioesterase-1|uniref:arylesterase n=1 Tax=Marinobacter TaxID=2742 RepID=UPI0020064A4F|nr:MULTISPECIES: arylesterase [Marinobacter]MCK7552468.1 arylesterase [Marinobacter goseongensis]MDV3503923.1 arylesterase [Marinobacter sp. M-5]